MRPGLESHLLRLQNGGSGEPGQSAKRLSSPGVPLRNIFLSRMFTEGLTDTINLEAQRSE
jgi:hypothetical protein